MGGNMRFLNNIWWWFLHRTFYRFHVHTLSLKPGWHDADVKMLHACFDFFCDFVEKEKGLDVAWYQFDYAAACLKKKDFEPYGNEKDLKERIKSSYEVAATLQYLYTWWKNEYLNHVYNTYEEEQVFEELTQENLLKLIKYRAYMWT